YNFCLKRLVQNTPKDLEGNTNKTNISVWDFAGQYAFYNTHQVFLTRRAIYLIVTDMSKDISDEVDDTCFEDSTGGRKLQFVDFARFWLNSIHEFCKSEKKGEPPVLLVGTFADKYAKRQKIDETKYRMGKTDLEKKYFRPLRTKLGDGEAKYHILKHFMIDNTFTVDTSGQFEELKREILEISKKQSYIGDLIPTKFLLLEEALNKKKEQGIKILNKETDFSKCNEELPFKLDEKEVAVFLKFFHEVGSFIYFNENSLKDYILLDPQWLIDAFKELITAEEFMPNEDSETFEIWQQFNETAILKKDLIDTCWKGMTMSERTLLLEYMEKFGLIVKDREKQDSYFAPCILKQAPSEDLLKLGDIKKRKCHFSADGTTFTSKLCYTTKSKFIPLAIFNRLLVECVSRWNIRREKNRETGEERVDIYCGCGIFRLRSAHILYVHFRNNVVQIWIVRCSDNLPSKEICLDVKKRMDEFFEKVFKKCEVECHFKCPTAPSWENAMHTLDELKQGNSVLCDYHNYELTSLDLTGCWFSDDRNDGDTKAVAERTSSTMSSRQIGQPFKKEHDDTLCQSMVSALHEQMESVGVLIFCGKTIGTVFRVGSTFVMTAFHVIKIVLDPFKSGSPDAARLESDNTFINFNESPCTPPVVAYKLKKEFIYNVDLDVAVLEIQNPLFNLPKKLNLRKAATDATHVYLIGYGHPGEPNKCLDPKCPIVSPNSKRLQEALAHRSELEKMGLSPSLVDKEYQKYFRSSKIVFDCFMEHGASGAPALAYNNQSVEVVGILTHGLPELYFNLPEHMKRQFPRSLRLEGGAKMQDIFEWVGKILPPALVHDMFN
ncbi:uncharacterized protein LOC128554301, partial [Mercenaria mercenaria]|uniref:uncharacterized protein LOC128554301 n=1 Tax=Mercenaria mercenaria TaxID=6596 RepID=UPI00234EF82D